MTDMTVTSTINAGLSIQYGDFRLLVDPFPMQKIGDFSAMSPGMLDETLSLPAFQDPDVLFFTHNHPDHYSEFAAQKLLSLYPHTQVIMPDCPFDNGINLTRDAAYTVNGHSLHFISLPHDGEEYADVNHYGLICEFDDRSLLITGDCLIASPVLREKTKNYRIDTVAVCFPWVVLPKGIQFIDSTIKPAHILVNHLPLPEDDVRGYADKAVRYSPRITSTKDIRMMDSFLKKEIL